MKEQDILEDAYNQFQEYLQTPPYVSRKGIEAILAEVGEKELAARQIKADDVIDMRFVTELEKEGFFKKLGGK